PAGGGAVRGTVSAVQRRGAGGRGGRPSPGADGAVFGGRDAGVLVHGRGFGNRIGGRSGGGDVTGLAHLIPRQCAGLLAPLADQLLHIRLEPLAVAARDRKSTRLNSSHLVISYAVFCLKKKKTNINN